MAATVPSPTPATSTHSPNIVPMLLHAFTHAFTALMTSSPLVAVLIGAGVLVAVTDFIRQLIHGGNRRDPIRRFSRTDRSLLLNYAGGRCEHHSAVFGRCKSTERLEADHVHPHSHGGQTALGNGQMLCKRHNQTKRAAVPFGWQLHALEKRRTTYYPSGVSGAVTRHAPPPPRLRGRTTRRTPSA